METVMLVVDEGLSEGLREIENVSLSTGDADAVGERPE